MMAKAFVSFSLFFLLIFIAYPALTAIQVIADIKKPKRLVTRLFHRDSILPPHKRLHDTRGVVDLVESSVARFSFLKNIRMEGDFNTNEFEVDLPFYLFVPSEFLNWRATNPPTCCHGHR